MCAAMLMTFLQGTTEKTADLEGAVTDTAKGAGRDLTRPGLLRGGLRLPDQHGVHRQRHRLGAGGLLGALRLPDPDARAAPRAAAEAQGRGPSRRGGSGAHKAPGHRDHPHKERPSLHNLLIVVLFILSIFVRNPLPATAGATIIAAVIGFGAQSFLRDDSRVLDHLRGAVQRRRLYPREAAGGLRHRRGAGPAHDQDTLALGRGELHPKRRHAGRDQLRLGPAALYRRGTALGPRGGPPSPRPSTRSRSSTSPRRASWSARRPTAGCGCASWPGSSHRWHGWSRRASWSASRPPPARTPSRPTPRLQGRPGKPPQGQGSTAARGGEEPAPGGRKETSRVRRCGRAAPPQSAASGIRLWSSMAPRHALWDAPR